MTCPINNLPQKLRLGLIVTLSSFALLLLSFVIRHFLAENNSWLQLSVQSLTLCIFIPGIIGRHYRTYSWLCFVVLIHFMSAVVNAMSPQPLWIDFIQVILTVSLFIGAMMTSRWMQYYQYYYASASDSSSQHNDK